jgi:glycosyltransferase involved in cell wall biosynthesis
MALSIAIITFNESQNITRALTSARPVAEDIVVVDSMSTDGTAEICRSFGCRVFERPFDGYGSTKQFAVDQALNDWVLVLDADEVITPELQAELRMLFTGNAVPAVSGFRIPRSLHFLGRVMKHSGTSGEMLLRLFDRRRGAFTNAAVHEEILVDGQTGTLQGGLIHYSYRDIRHHIEKLNHYSSLAAEDYVRKGRRFGKVWVAVKFPATFFTFYILKGGILDGYPGFMWSFLAGVYASLKVAKTIEKY